MALRGALVDRAGGAGDPLEGRQAEPLPFQLLLLGGIEIGGADFLGGVAQQFNLTITFCGALLQFPHPGAGRGETGMHGCHP